MEESVEAGEILIVNRGSTNQFFGIALPGGKVFHMDGRRGSMIISSYSDFSKGEPVICERVPMQERVRILEEVSRRLRNARKMPSRIPVREQGGSRYAEGNIGRGLVWALGGLAALILLRPLFMRTS